MQYLEGYLEVRQRAKDLDLLDKTVTLKKFTEETRVKFLGLFQDDHGTVHAVIRRDENPLRSEAVHFSCIVDLMKDEKE